MAAGRKGVVLQLGKLGVGITIPHHSNRLQTVRKDLDIGGLIIELRQIGWSGINWTNLAEDRDQWRALVSKVIELLGSIKRWKIIESLHKWQLVEKS
jgi:hypothetical protein